MLQLTREQPPGYGGVERVAHEVADAIAVHGLTPTSQVYFFFGSSDPDPLPIHYGRIKMRAWALGRLPLPLPCRALIRLLLSQDALIAHLPCPTVLGLAILCKLLRPQRRVSIYWHSFLDVNPTAVGMLVGLYQQVAQALMRLFDQVITTSPILQDELGHSARLPATRMTVMPCCVPESLELEAKAAQADARSAPCPETLRLITISRLASYKRIDWLLDAIEAANVSLVPAGRAIRLDVVGDGPDRDHLVCCVERSPLLEGLVEFHGRVEELRKQQLLAAADLLMLMADSCHEAFGIVQLEAMAYGVPAIALKYPRSGAYWVSHTPSQRWDGHHRSLVPFLLDLARQPDPQLNLLRQETLQRYHSEFQRSIWMKRLLQLLEA
jgi:glycosyltransferase involved in cell wall biosynthesis